jgi:hypothetical protein
MPSDLRRKGVIISGINQLWRLLAGPVVSVYCIPAFLSPEQQGLWFTIISLSALTTFADMGFTNIIMQFAAHEFAFLHFDRNKRLSGEQERIEKLMSLFRFSMKWIGMATALFMPVIMAVALFFFTKEGRTWSWLFPWCIYLIAAGIGMILNVVQSFLEGCDEISTIQSIKTLGAIVNSTCLIAMLASGCGLYALAVSAFSSNVILGCLTILKYRKFLFAYRTTVATGASEKEWLRGILKLLWRYALSWACGYFSLQFYVPIMLKARGEVAAGKVGLSWSIMSAAFSLANVWIYTAIPRINILIEKKSWIELRNLAVRRCLLSLTTYAFGVGGFIVGLGIIGGSLGIRDRFLPINGLAIVASAWMMQMILNTIATVLRGFKEEPFVALSIAGTAWTIASSILCARFMNIEMYFLGFLTSFIMTLPWAFLLLACKVKKIRIGMVCA